MKDSLIYIVELLLKRNKIFFDKKELSFQIKSHPSYPSLHAITGVLDHFGIENIAADVPVNSETLLQLPDCFLVQVQSNQIKDLAVVERKNNNYFLYLEDKKEKLTEIEFLKKFTGIIVVVEKDEENNQKPKETKLKELIGFVILALLSSYIFFINKTSWHSIVYLLLSITGLVTSIAIVKQELGLKTTIGNAFCSGADEKKDCDAVLTSKGAEIIKGYKLSDLSILYFIGLTFLTLIQITKPTLSYAISLLAIPITLYSLYYQYAVVKKWCLLCLSIVVVLWLQAVFPLIKNVFSNDFLVNDFVILFITATLTWLIWSYIKPLLIEVNSLRKERIESVKFKRNFGLFNSLLQKSSTLNTSIQSIEEIVLGNPNSALEIVVVTNPFCGHCKPVHKHIDEILKRYNENVKIVIRFNINVNDKDSDAVKITSRLIEIYNIEGAKFCLEAMDDIYGGQKPKDWLIKWKDCTNKEKYILELETEKDWCKKNTINFTPEILVNGKSYPKEYNRTDLIFFIEDLEESCNANTQLVE